MPKVILDPYKRKHEAFLRWFKGKRAECSVTQKDLAEEVRCTQAEISNKTTGKAVITYKDLLIFFKEVDATDEEIVRMMRL